MTTVLRIGIVVPRFAPFRGGMETYVASAAAALAAEGAEVTVITQAPRAAALPRQEVRDGYTVERHHLPVGDIFDLPAPAAARAAGETGRFDVEWVHNYHMPLAWLAAEHATAPVVFTPHYHGVGHTPLRHALHRAWRPAGRRLMAVSRRIVVDTEAEASLVLRDFPSQVQRETVSVIPPAVADPSRGHDPYPHVGNVVLTVARQEPYKRTDLLVRAVAELHHRGRPARLVVVGDGSALPALRRLTVELDAEDAVTFTGAVDDDALGRWWATAALYATASRQEAYGIGLAEALVAGLPVVVSDIAAHREVVERAGPGVAARLCTTDSTDTATARRYADAIDALLFMAASSRDRGPQCKLPSAGQVVGQLLETLSAARRVGSRV
ncbi:glycosyltransferase family 4 protein [Mycobacterium sp. NAZ190054]|uniref:glycosyltransferase family 4 protein n=1 Tax=Mycobacterium sp. NAZ190054 TaxID=1747766 RepID=UPI00079A083B|nr:glycosyltransferase family 4 protein [Mycobacterium sp. NAZ190054]KWX56732.1 hypothetical protein ASJ79_02165 [Mycobacterium sp. NAZ190054]